MSAETTRIAMVCVQNAGRSQMATAYAEREREARGLADAVEIRSGGTHPAESVHDVVLEAMDEEGIDLSDRAPREITEAELEACDYVATMGCSTLELDADADVRDWNLEDPHGRDLESVREIREDVKARVEALFGEIEAERSE
ncbi:arsenate-mycothiol transferase ArsC [Natronococcus wangiae]|uniref:arsenate-mycothiol transferase ArsC n=1 Tax=Natronococcus wangiae TaxID=3068275 RepID=UPI00273EEA02|nr:low molecular weight phosphatase family protein [Natronococcus sp. AD5]